MIHYLCVFLCSKIALQRLVTHLHTETEVSPAIDTETSLNEEFVYKHVLFSEFV